MNGFNTIGIENAPRVRRLLSIGLAASALAAAGDMILGWGNYDANVSGLAYFFSLYRHVSDTRLLLCALMGMVGMTLEMLCLSGVCRLMADDAPKLAHAYRSGIFGCLTFGVCGYHVAFVAMFYVYKNVCELVGAETALEIITRYALFFVAPEVGLFFVFLILLTVVQLRAFVGGHTPLPRRSWVFSAGLMGCLVYMFCCLIGNHPLANAIGTAWFHMGCLWMYGGLLTSVRTRIR